MLKRTLVVLMAICSTASLTACPAPSTGIGGGGGSLGGGLGGGGGTGGGTTGGGTGGGTTGGGTTGGGTTGGGTGGGSTGGGGATGDGAFFQLDVGTDYPTAVADAAGVFHVAYGTGFGQTLRYGRCATGCGLPTAWTFTTLFQLNGTGSVDHGRIGVGPGNVVHIIYDRVLNSSDSTWYATCASNCSNAASWQHTDLTAVVSGRYAFRGSPMVVDSSGRISFVTSDLSLGGPVYLNTCASNCTNTASWSTGTMRQGGNRTTLAAGGTTLHRVTYDDNSRLRYASCASNCTTTAGWTESGPIFVHDGTMPTSLVVEAGGRLHLAYNQGYTAPSEPQNIKDQAYKLLVWQCDSNCTADTSWSGVILGSANDGEEGISLAELGGALVLSVTNGTSLVAGVCTGTCTNSANWGFGTIDDLASMSASVDPYQAFLCSGTRPSFAAWYPNDGVVALSPTTGSALFVNAPYAIKTCAGTQTRSAGNLRVVFSQ